MKYRPYLIALSVVVAWGIFACAYLGVEDGSSGLSPLGCLHVWFFLPGLQLFRVFNSSYSNSDTPVIGGISWIVLTVLALGIAHLVVVARREKERESNHIVQDIGSNAPNLDD